MNEHDAQPQSDVPANSADSASDDLAAESAAANPMAEELSDGSPPIRPSESAGPVENSAAVDSDQPTAPAMNIDPMVNPSRSIRPLGIEGAKRLAAMAVQVAQDNNGRDVMVIDVSNQSAEFDFFVLATGSSRRQLHAISEQIDDALEKGLGETRIGIEGYDESRWIVLDYGSIVIHLFDEDTRDFYDLESLWADGTMVPLDSLPSVS